MSLPSSAGSAVDGAPVRERAAHPAHDNTTDALPLVSVVVLNHARAACSARVLASVIEQDYRNREIIVVDNESRGELRAILQSISSEVILIELAENAGACGGRNAGIRRARGQIIVTLDDDVLFATPRELSEIVETLADHPETSVLAFQVCSPRTGQISVRDWCHPRPYQEFADAEFETYFFIEGAVAYRREVFQAAGLYDERLFLYGEGYDLAMRLIDRGFLIRYSPRVRVWHLQSPEGRTSERSYYFHTRNYIWIACKDYPWPSALRFLLPKLAMMSYFALRTRMVRAFLRGLKDGLVGLRQVWRDRAPASRATVAYLAEQDRWRPGLFERLARHRQAPQL